MFTVVLKPQKVCLFGSQRVYRNFVKKNEYISFFSLQHRLLFINALDYMNCHLCYYLKVICTCIFENDLKSILCSILIFMKKAQKTMPI